MTVFIDKGLFTHEDLTIGDFVVVSSDTKPHDLEQALKTASGFIIEFPSFADGRGFSIARSLRNLGFKGHLRAQGHVVVDQYPLAIRSGFDDVEIEEELAARQPEAQWLEAYSRVGHTYLEGLMRPLEVA